MRPAEPGIVAVKWGDSKQDFFMENLDGTYSAYQCYTDAQLTETALGVYQVSFPDGLRYRFDGDGRLTEVSERNGNSISLTYSPHLSQITDTAGRQINLTYNAQGFLTGIVSPITSGNTAAFAYDASGNLISMTDARGNARQFAYDASHRLVTYTDQRGNKAVTNVYDSSGRVSQQSNALGQITTFQYYSDPLGSHTCITPPSGNVIWQYYDAKRNLIRSVDGEGYTATFNSDDNGRLTAATDKNASFYGLSHDTTGNLTTIPDALGNQANVAYNSFNQPTGLSGNLGASGHSYGAQVGYDSNGNITSMSVDGLGDSATYDASGMPLVRTDRGGNATTFTYSSAGQLQSRTDALGSQITYSHDAAGRLVQSSGPLPGQVCTKTYDANGNVLALTDSSGARFTYAYDANDNCTNITYPDGSMTTFTYDALNRRVSARNAGGVSTWTYDANGNVTNQTDADGVVTSFQFNRRNQVIAATDGAGNTQRFGYDANGNRSSGTNALGAVWTYAYDANNRVTQTITPNGYSASFTYDALGRKVGVTDSLGYSVDTTYSTLGPTAQTWADGSSATYAYDNNGNATRITDPAGHTWQYTYDALNRRTAMQDPDGNSEKYEYDAGGHNTAKITRAGQRITYTYDANGRLTSQTLAGSPVVYYAHDSMGNLVAVGDVSGTNFWSRDAQERITGMTNADDATVACAYTAGGRIASLTYPGNHKVQYAYDSGGRLASVTDWAAHNTQYTYDAANRITSIHLPNGTWTRYTYDPDGHATGISHQTSNGGNMATYTLRRDNSGKIIGVTFTGNLPSTPNPPTEAFKYDAANHILQATENGVTNQCRFDLNGNMLAEGTITNTFDGLNRLVARQESTGKRTYAYDAVGYLRAISGNGSTNRYINLDGDILARNNAQGQTLFIHGPGLLYRVSPDGSIQVLHADMRGNIVAITDAKQAIIQTYAYSPYGIASALNQTVSNEFRFLGAAGVVTDDNGLCLAGARCYEPQLGRFLTEDPLGKDTVQNLFAYANGDPVNGIDPSGLADNEAGTGDNEESNNPYPGAGMEKIQSHVLGKIVKVSEHGVEEALGYFLPAKYTKLQLGEILKTLYENRKAGNNEETYNSFSETTASAGDPFEKFLEMMTEDGYKAIRDSRGFKDLWNGIVTTVGGYRLGGRIIVTYVWDAASRTVVPLVTRATGTLAADVAEVSAGTTVVAGTVTFIVFYGGTRVVANRAGLVYDPSTKQTESLDDGWTWVMSNYVIGQPEEDVDNYYRHKYRLLYQQWTSDLRQTPTVCK